MQAQFEFAKLVSTPTATSWSQAYSAGKLCAVLSLTSEDNELLASTGKETLETLEQEFFTLEKKDLPSIKEAVTLALKKIPNDVTSCFVAGVLQDSVLYLCVKGGGDVFMFRNGKLGSIIDQDEDEELKAYSGYLKEGDKVIFGTDKFFQEIQKAVIEKYIAQALSEVTEDLMPLLHQTEGGGAAAVILAYSHAEEEPDVLPTLGDLETEDSAAQEPEDLLTPAYGRQEKLLPKLPHVSFPLPHFRINKIKLLFLAVAASLLLLLITNIYHSFKKRSDEKLQAAFDAVYPQAQKKYDEGESLLTLNKNLAHDSFVAAAKILQDNKTKFPEDSKEGQQIAALTKKVQDAVGGAPATSPIQPQEVSLDQSDMLKAEKDSTSNYFTKDSKNIYFVSLSGVTSVDRKSGSAKIIIKNDSAWSSPSGIATYLGNIYVLDKKAGILKFSVSDNGYGKSSYLASDVTADFSKSTAMAIDGSVYVLSNGVIAKFTRGRPSDFKLTGVDKSLAGATRLFTNDTTDTLYVLDPANNRIVVVGKDGTYRNQYQATVLKTAQDLDVLEKDKKIFVLSSGKLYQIAIQ